MVSGGKERDHMNYQSRLSKMENFSVETDTYLPLPVIKDDKDHQFVDDSFSLFHLSRDSV